MECNICLSSINTELVYMNCSCKHTIFHKTCLDKWLKMSRTCPFCKYNYKSVPKKFSTEKSELDKALVMDSINRYPSIVYDDYVEDNYTNNNYISNYTITPYL